MSSASSVSIGASPAALQSLWLDILRKIEPKVQRSQFITWFKVTAILGQEDGNLVVGLPLPIHLNWHMENYRSLTLEAAQELDRDIQHIVYKVETALKDDPSLTPDLLQFFPGIFQIPDHRIEGIS